MRSKKGFFRTRKIRSCWRAVGNDPRREKIECCRKEGRITGTMPSNGEVGLGCRAGEEGHGQFTEGSRRKGSDAGHASVRWWELGEVLF